MKDKRLNCIVGKKWYDRRKIITPAFHFNILERFVEVFDRLGNTVVDKLNTLHTNQDVEFYPIAVLYALDVMCGESFELHFKAKKTKLISFIINYEMCE